MSTLTDLEPRKRNRVIDLVAVAGMDTAPWADYRGGKARASTNPKYCYEWAFVDPGKRVVLNLWFHNLHNFNGRIAQRLNLRKRAGLKARTPSEVVWKARALRMDQAIQHAYQNQLPVNVIICDGKMREAGDPAAKASQVKFRHLDSARWTVTRYDRASGACLLVRGKRPVAPKIVLDDEELLAFEEGEQRRRFVMHRKRERKARLRKIQEALRANGGRLVCEVRNCGFDFADRYGPLGVGYAHVHHKTPLHRAPKDGRKVRLSDLAIVCANCHAMIHVGGECRPIETLISARRVGAARR